MFSLAIQTLPTNYRQSHGAELFCIGIGARVASFFGIQQQKESNN
jgi:hypothetical protein